MSYTQSQATAVLRNLGFRVRTTGEFTQSVRAFQNGYNLGAWLAVDGLCGPKTSAALARCEANRRGGKSTASAHFNWTDFRCGCGGRYEGCRLVLVRREFLSSLEKYRARVGASVRIVSGYRCPTHNAVVGGAKASQHMYGTAADVDYRLSDSEVKGLWAFSGIGRSGKTRMVRHIDRRDISGHNNGGTLGRPMVWNYAS